MLDKSNGFLRKICYCLAINSYKLSGKGKNNSLFEFSNYIPFVEFYVIIDYKIIVEENRLKRS